MPARSMKEMPVGCLNTDVDRVEYVDAPPGEVGEVGGIVVVRKWGDWGDWGGWGDWGDLGDWGVLDLGVLDFFKSLLEVFIRVIFDLCRVIDCLR